MKLFRCKQRYWSVFICKSNATLLPPSVIQDTHLTPQHSELSAATVTTLPISPVRGAVSSEHSIALTDSGKVVALCLQNVDSILGRRDNKTSNTHTDEILFGCVKNLTWQCKFVSSDIDTLSLSQNIHECICEQCTMSIMYHWTWCAPPCVTHSYPTIHPGWKRSHTWVPSHPH